MLLEKIISSPLWVWVLSKITPKNTRKIETTNIVTPVVSAPSLVIKDVVNILPWNENSANRWKIRKISDIQQIVVHQALGTKTASATNAYHISKDCHIAPGVGLPHLAYTYFIDYTSGEVFLCNAWDNITWHVANKNTKSLGICVGGWFDYTDIKCRDGNPTDLQITNLKLLLDKITQELSIPKTSVYTHNALQEKPACPGIKLEQFVKEYNGEIV
jgi:hypothetical protein